MSMKIGSLFSGYGGLDMAVCEAFGAEVAWHSEIDKAPAKILEYHYPHIPNLGDVTKIDWSKVEPVDIITGGYPCQPFSQAGQRKGETDERHLWPYILTAIRLLQPQLAVLENVAGHLTLGFARVLADLAEIGWDAQWATLRASDIGAPHHRERLFILAYPSGQRQQTQRLASGPTQEIARNNHMLEALAGASGSDLELHARARVGEAWERIIAWGTVVGRVWPFPTEEAVSYHDEDLWGKAFPIVKTQTNPEFIEWMMGLPEGWVTSPEIGLTRAQQLKAIGNGVVPQQALMALQQLLKEHG